jgi:hypothetical protein
MGFCNKPRCLLIIASTNRRQNKKKCVVVVRHPAAISFQLLKRADLIRHNKIVQFSCCVRPRVFGRFSVHREGERRRIMLHTKRDVSIFKPSLQAFLIALTSVLLKLFYAAVKGTHNSKTRYCIITAKTKWSYSLST